MIGDHRSRMYARYRSLMGHGATVPIALSDNSRRPFYDRLVKAYLPEDKSAAVLELACGDGGLLRCLAAHGYGDALGVDLSPEQVARAHAAGTLRVEQSDVFDSLERLPESSKDGVVAIDLLEHLDKEEAMKLLDEVYRVLRPGGRFLMHTVNAESPFFGRVRYGDFTHRNAFTKLSIEQVCLAAQFARTECHEDPPAVHGLKSAVRWGLWQAVRTVLRTALVAETGSLQDPILSQNLFAVAFK